VEEPTRITILTVVGEAPIAPIGFSHKCSNKLIFKNGTITLTMENVQVWVFLILLRQKMSLAKNINYYM